MADFDTVIVDLNGDLSLFRRARAEAERARIPCRFFTFLRHPLSPSKSKGPYDERVQHDHRSAPAFG